MKSARSDILIRAGKSLANHQIRPQHVQPGKSMQNGYIERFNKRPQVRFRLFLSLVICLVICLMILCLS